jgi:hypothetical protein
MKLRMSEPTTTAEPKLIDQILDLRAPHASLRFLDHFTGKGDAEGLWPSRAAALQALFKSGSRIGVWLPKAMGLPSNLIWEPLPRDPEDFLACSLAGLDGLYVCNPNPIDGYFMPDEIYISLLKHALTVPGLRVISDESLFSYRHEPYACGTASHLLPSGRVGMLYALEEWDGRAGALLWGLKAETLPATQLDERSAGALIALQRRDFVGSLDLLRWTTNAGRAMRSFTENIRPAIDQGLIRIEHWPKAGHRLLVHAKAPFQGELFLKRLEKEALVQALSGDQVGVPGSLLFDLAQPVRIAREAAQRFVKLVLSTLT